MAASYQIYVTHIVVNVDMVKKIKCELLFYDKKVGQPIVHRITLYINEEIIKTISTCTLLETFNSVFTCLGDNQYQYLQERDTFFEFVF